VYLFETVSHASSLDPILHISHSTDIFPEWPFASLPIVPEDVQQEVQSALLALEVHAGAGRALQDCVEEEGKTLAQCESVFDSARCDTTLVSIHGFLCAWFLFLDLR